VFFLDDDEAGLAVAAGEGQASLASLARAWASKLRAIGRDRPKSFDETTLDKHGTRLSLRAADAACPRLGRALKPWRAL
jgi:hypothetical protein